MSTPIAQPKRLSIFTGLVGVPYSDTLVYTCHVAVTGPSGPPVVSWNLLHGGHPDRVEIRAVTTAGPGEWETKFARRDSVFSSIKDEDAPSKLPNPTGYDVQITCQEHNPLETLGVTLLREQRGLPQSPLENWSGEVGVPPLRQMDQEQFWEHYPDREFPEPYTLGRVVCCPTSMAMALSAQGDPCEPWEVAQLCYDLKTELYGVWGMTTGTARRFGTSNCYVAVTEGLHEVQRILAAGKPVVASIRWGQGELTGAPIPSSAGHIVVISGFTPNGDVIVMDPRAVEPDPVRRVYSRAEFENALYVRADGVIFTFE